MPTTLLTASDDSDDGGLERRPPRRRFFQKSERGSKRFVLDISFCHCLLLSILSLSLIYVALNTYSLTKHYAELRESVSAVAQLTNRLETLEFGMNRLRLEFDFWKENFSNDSTHEATDYVFDVMKKLSLDVREMKKRVEMATRVTDDVTRRMTTVETRCLNVCRQSSRREGDKQRRRQAAKVLSDDDEIIFRRN
ncbi:hypothetical protein V3C99_010794 [Haemonchus contortus]|uniref:Col_cuticle_N domain-containing protein n=1 Tax=Haemonchus contortus TaxID=6289 RepID=A0A7I4Y7A4_HAECO|nr:unnamed protein product [Haemonchus contortus]